jgi:hypothetical protein
VLATFSVKVKVKVKRTCDSKSRIVLKRKYKEIKQMAQ